MQKRERNVQKNVMHVRSCCFAYVTYCFFYFLVAIPFIEFFSLKQYVKGFERIHAGEYVRLVILAIFSGAPRVPERSPMAKNIW